MCSKSLLGHKALLIKGLKPQATGVVKKYGLQKLHKHVMEMERHSSIYKNYVKTSFNHTEVYII